MTESGPRAGAGTGAGRTAAMPEWGPGGGGGGGRGRTAAMTDRLGGRGGHRGTAALSGRVRGGGARRAPVNAGRAAIRPLRPALTATVAVNAAGPRYAALRAVLT